MGRFLNLFAKTTHQLAAPVAGHTVPLSQVNDPSFSEEVLGKGVAICPSDGSIYAPCDGVIEMAFETGHAVSIRADFGAEVLIHIGLDTVNLCGEHFTVYCASGDRVTKGELLIEFDHVTIAAEGYDTVTPMVICNTGDYTVFDAVTGRDVNAGDTVLEISE